MKMIVAIIQHTRLDEVRRALAQVDVHGMTVSDTRGFGRQKGHTELYRSAEYTVDFLPKCKIEIAAAESQVDAIVAAIVNAARTDTIGDGKIFVLPIDQVVRIRTGERDENAI